MTNTFVTQELAAAHIRELQHEAEHRRRARLARTARVDAARGARRSSRPLAGVRSISAWTRSLPRRLAGFLDAGQLGPAYRARCW